MFVYSFDAFNTCDMFGKELSYRVVPETRKPKKKFVSSAESCWQLDFGEFLNTLCMKTGAHDSLNMNRPSKLTGFLLQHKALKLILQE